MVRGAGRVWGGSARSEFFGSACSGRLWKWARCGIVKVYWEFAVTAAAFTIVFTSVVASHLLTDATVLTARDSTEDTAAFECTDLI